jgi:hypothetical protein
VRTPLGVAVDCGEGTKGVTDIEMLGECEEDGDGVALREKMLRLFVSVVDEERDIEGEPEKEPEDDADRDAPALPLEKSDGEGEALASPEALSDGEEDKLAEKEREKEVKRGVGVWG